MSMEKDMGVVDIQARIHAADYKRRVSEINLGDLITNAKFAEQDILKRGGDPTRVQTNFSMPQLIFLLETIEKLQTRVAELELDAGREP